MLCVSLTLLLANTDALAKIKLGIMDGVLYTSQTVTFTCQLSRAHHVIKWFKEGTECCEGDKYHMSVENDGERHLLAVNDVQGDDEGIYTFKVIGDASVKVNVVATQGQWPAAVNVMNDSFRFE